MHVHEIEEAEFAAGPALWDATPGVCCAAFQLGACAHTEAFDQYDEETFTVNVDTDPDIIIEDAYEPF